VIASASIEKELTSVAGQTTVHPPSPAFVVDGVVPQAVVRPTTYDQIASVLRWADERRLAVIPLGGRAHVSRGNIPARYDIALDLTGLDNLVEFEPGDLTITMQAGMTLAKLRKTTGASGLLSPFDPWAPDRATAGGMIAAAVSGPARISLGTPRDFTIGLRVITTDGKITRAGGKVVKNVSGYDLCKLYTGSMGTLGVIVEACIKLQPQPTAEGVVAVDFESSAEACTLANRVYTAGLNLRAAVLSRAGATWQLTLHLAGSAAGVERSRHDIERISGRPATPPSKIGEGARDIVLRLSALPSRLPHLLTGLSAALPEADLEAYPTVALCLVTGNASAVEIERVRLIAAKHDAACVIEQCPPGAKRDLDVLSVAIPSLKLMRRIKREWDANGTLSPGRGPGKI